MTIYRGREPQGNFQILPNATARDRRLSFRARGLLVLMLSHPADWQFNRDWLARQSDGEGVSAVRTALQELERHGYLVRRRIRVDGRFTWVQKIYRTPQPQENQVEPIGGKPADGNPADENQPSQEDGNENDHEDVMYCPPDRRADEDSEPGGSWRDEDRALFAELIGADTIRSDGTRWIEGEWPTEVFYEQFRKARGHRWPGRRLQRIEETNGVNEWLFSEGLEPSY